MKHDPNAPLTLDCTPLPQPANAFAHMAAGLRATVFPNIETRNKAAELVGLLDWLAIQVPEGTSQEPTVLATLGRLALDATERARFRAILDHLDVVLAQAASNQAGPAPTNGAAGYRLQ